MGEFRVPGADETDMTDEELYEAIVKFAEQSFGDISEERIEGIKFREKDPKYEQDIIDVDVGDVFPITGEPVEAILYDESRDLYLVCTPTRGVAEGQPILVGNSKVRDIRHFD
jgi:hypothetical protein